MRCVRVPVQRVRETYALAMDLERLISGRVRSVEASGIRRVFELGVSLKDPIDLSIGQPDFQPPKAMQDAAVAAIQGGRNGYTPSQGIQALRDRIWSHLATDIGWKAADGLGAMVTSGTLGGIYLAYVSLLDPGDEIIMSDPYFVAYPHLARLLGAKPVLCDTYPDFRMTAERVEPLITPRTKAVLLNSPANPVGVVLSAKECRDLLDLCRRKGVMLISDEIYDAFVFDDARDPESGRCPSPCRFDGAKEGVLLIRGFGKTYGVTGWRMGYAAGPARLITEMTKAQQYTFTCSPSIAQYGCLAALDCDMSETVRRYQRRRDLCVERLSKVTEVARPGGAFYVFPRVPERLGLTAQQFAEQAVTRNVLVIPGNVFSTRDTHFRVSFAASEERLERGLGILAEMLKG